MTTPDNTCGSGAGCLYKDAQIEHLEAELERLRSAVHSCGPTCDKAGCVNARLTQELERLRAQVASLSREAWTWSKALESQLAAPNPAIPLSAIRPIAVEAIRAVTGRPDLKGNEGRYLVDELESIAKAAAETLGAAADKQSLTVGDEPVALRQVAEAALKAFKVFGDADDYPSAIELHAKMDALEAALAAPQATTDGDERRHVICLCPDCTKPAAQTMARAKEQIEAGAKAMLEPGWYWDKLSEVERDVFRARAGDVLVAAKFAASPSHQPAQAEPATGATRCRDMAERIMLALDAYDKDQSEEFMDEVFSGLLPDAHDLMILLATARGEPAAHAKPVAVGKRGTPLTEQQIQDEVYRVRRAGFAAELVSFREGVRFAERANRIGTAAAQAEPVAYMREGWGPDCGPYTEFYRADEMSYRDKAEYTPLYPPSNPPAQGVAAFEAWCAERMPGCDAAQRLIAQKAWRAALAQAPAAEPLTDERAVLRHVATLAHEGGLSKLNEHGVMCEIRRLSMPYWDDSGTYDTAVARVNAALTAAKL
jgi:hypothetical protein